MVTTRITFIQADFEQNSVLTTKCKETKQENVFQYTLGPNNISCRGNSGISNQMGWWRVREGVKTVMPGWCKKMQESALVQTSEFSCFKHPT